ncbi:hypothetical protein ILYODFUR_035654 [Ilyodon furcidens]|uniref:Uncharacterized protein n=1 Tax=Ilyodon furcidens TaxID=33524 RepID=A0ABV0TDV2_9TELE
MRMGVVEDWGRGMGLGSGPGSLRFRHEPGSGAGAVHLSLPPEGRGPPSGSRGWLPLWGIGTWTWEYRVCMGSVSECTMSMDACLYVRCVGVSVMCTHEGGNV